MSPTAKRTKTTRAFNFRTSAFPAHPLIAQLLVFMLLMQTIAPPALAASSQGFSLSSLGRRASSSLAAVFGTPGAGTRATSAPAVTIKPATEEFGVVLTPLSTAFAAHAGIEHHQPLRKVVVSANNPAGVPLNFETLDADGTHRPYSNVAGLTGALKIATARDDGAGMSRGGFKPGELFSATGAPGVIARVAADASSLQNPWVTLTGEGDQSSGGMFVDRTGVFGGDLIAVTTAGGVWRINSAGVAARIAGLGTPLEGVTTIPDDVTKYGPWAGRILAGAKEQGTVYAIDAQGNATAYQLGLNPSDIRVIPAHENFYGVDPAGGKIWGAPDEAFAGIIGDILIAQGSPGVLARVRWNGTEFEVGQLAAVPSWKQITFSPAALSEIGGVKQVYDKLAVVRHAPQLDSGRVEGALWQLLPENVVLDGTDVITSDLLVPGSPAVTVGSGKPSFDGVIEGVENTQPTGYSVSISNNASLRHVITRTNPISLTPVPAPAATAGTRDVSLTKAGETISDAATLRHLSISGKAGAVAVPPGSYGKFTATSHTQLVFGVEGATVPSVYDLEDLSLSGGSELRLLGPVKLNVRGNVSLSGSTIGAANDPQRLLLSVAQGAVGVTGGGVLYGIIRIPQGSVSIGGNGRIRGTVTCDQLHIFGNGVLQITESDVAAPPVNRPPTADAGPDQTTTLPADVVSLNGTATDDGLPTGSTLVTNWTKVSGPGPVSFSAPGNTVSTATFSEPGIYVLRLSASDSLLTAFDEMTVEVIPHNQPPVVNAGPDQTIELPDGATLNGAVSDDALPRGSTVTKTWSVVSGSGAVDFADSHNLASGVTFAAPGVYILRLTADDTEFTVSDDVSITVYPENQPPVVNAGADQTVRLPQAVTLSGTATDDGFPHGSTLTKTWTKVSGPGVVTFADASSPVTVAQFGIEGTYVLRLTADDTRFTVSDECVVTVLPQNAPPVINAGLDQELTFLENVTLNGTATDDGLPVGSVLEVAWSVVSGPGTVNFANPDRPVTAATFSAPGAYVLRLTGDDTQFTASDEATIIVKQRPHASRVYTLDGDFDEGDLINVTHSTTDQLQLDSTTRSFKFIWVAVSTKGTVVKLNTETGAIIGEYFTSPNGQPRDPSRTTVDQNGSVWATNRAGNSVVHIGLVENGQCVDRNNNGVIDTSTGFNNIRAWPNTGGANTNGGVTLAQDECVLHYTKVNSFGTRHVSVTRDNDLWVSGTSGQRFDLIDGKTGLIKRAEPSVGYGGYGGLIDKNGVIWSANPMLRWDTANPLTGTNGVNWRGYSHPSYGLCIDSQGNVYNTSYGNGTVRKFAPNGTLLATYNQGFSYAQGCVVDRNDDVWIAHSLNSSSVGHLKSNGVYVGTIPVGSGPTGVAVDGDGKVWATNYYSGTVSRINPALGAIGGDGVTRVGAVDFTTPYLGGNPYNYSDMTGSTLTGAPNTGTWSVVFDSRIAGAEWGRIGWTAQVCGDGLLSVSVATSENNTNYTQPLVVSNGDDPVVPNGRYVKITVRFERASSGESPILYDLSIGTVGFPLDVPTNNAPGVDAGADQTLNGTTKTALRASVCGDALPSNQRLSMTWSQVSGPGTATFSRPNSPISDVTFSATGTYTLRMTATDSVHTGSDTLVVAVIPGNLAPVVNAGADQTIILPAAAALNGTVTDDGLPAGNVAATWTKLSGPGLVTFADPHQTSTTAAFTVAGTYVLRLEATDSDKGAFDDATVIVQPRPNRAPDITSEPPTELSLGAVPTGAGDLVNLAPWTTKQYELNSQPNANWVKDLPTNSVTQIVNADSAFLLSDFNLSNAQMEGTWRVNTNNDDDFMGFVFGYQNSEHFYLFDWKKADQNDPLGMAERGMSVKVFNASSPLTGADFWPTAGNGTRVRSLYHNTVPWKSFTDYAFTLQFRPGEIKITVREGAVVLADFTVNDSTYTNGLFGFYNYSQEQVKYSGFRRLSLAQATYLYDVEAVDPDGDAVAYSLDAAPPGMTINAASGLVNWPVTSREAGDHNVTVRAQDPQGASDTQSYTLTILNRNQPPVVNAGDDRAVSVNGTATLNGTVTDDNLPRNAAVTSVWSMVSGPGTVNFADSSSAATTATFTEPGTYVLRLSATDTALDASDEMIVTVTPPNRAPEVNAGADQIITLPGVVRLGGASADDGLPLGGTLTVAWSMVSGPGTISFADTAAAVTTAAFSEAGVYVLRLSATDTELTSADDVSVTVNPNAPNTSPVVNAGADVSVELNYNLVQNPGNDDELVNGEIRAWSEASGSSWTRAVSGTNGFPESVNGGSFFYAGETATAELRQDIDVSGFAATIAAGTQSFEWKTYVRSRVEALPDTARVILEYRNASNTAMIARLDSGEIATTNAWHLLEDTRPAPVATGWIRIRLIATRRTGTTNDAYFDGISLRAATGAGVKLSGTATDDGQPVLGALTANWAKVSGPGTVAFADAAAASTSATFSLAGTYVLRLSASDSELTSGDELTITVEPRNLAPVVEAGADQAVTLPATASLSGAVTDDGKPSGISITSLWSKVSGAGTVTFADAGALNTVATFSEAGAYVLRLSATDTEYNGSDTVTINVNPIPPNVAPTVNAGADQVVNPPETAAVLSGIVTDDGQPPNSSLTYAWAKVSGPGSVAFVSPAAAVTVATFSEAGVYVLRLSANDSQLTGSDEVRVTLNGANKAPTVNAGADRTVAYPTTVTIGGTATDDGLPLNSALSFNWTKASGPGTVTFANAASLQTTATFSAPGAYVLRLEAGDTELKSTDDVLVMQTPPPTAKINTPAEGSTITDRTLFVGTVSDGSAWRLEYSLNEDGTPPVWTTVSTGNMPVTNGTLGTFDPTVLLNGIYTVRLVATDAAGQTATTSVRAVVDSEQKVGNFQLSYTDLKVPMPGMSIEVGRAYDSRDKRRGDFGVGWTLNLRNVRLQESGDVGEGWQGIVNGGFFPSYCVQPTRSHLVTVSTPDGELHRFEAVLNTPCSTLYPLRETTIGFRPLTGTYSTLAPVGDATVFVLANFPGAADLLDYGTLEPKDFDDYRLTLPNGDVMLINQQGGLRQMTDPNGNSLTVNSNGVTHSSGKSIAFTRDAQGRITHITDPSGASLLYGYDAAGDLVSFKDRDGSQSSYGYNSTHGLLTINDPRGVQPLRNEYDDTGRLVRQVDALGKAITYARDLTTRQEVVTDREGKTAVYEYNARGQVVRITGATGGVITRTYNSRDQLLSETDAEGQITTYTYDAQDNRLSERDSDGNTTRYTYDGKGRVLTITNPKGGVTTYVYDAKGNITSVKDPLGNATGTIYNSKGLPVTDTDALGNVTTSEYDAFGNQTKTIDPLGNATTATFDANNNRLSETMTRTVGGVAQTLTTTYEYDRVGRPTRTTYPDGSASETVYNALGKVSAMVDNLGRRTEYAYDEMGRLARTTYPDNTKEEQGYDAEGRRTKLVDRAGRTTRYEYDAAGRPLKVIYPNGATATKTYDIAGQLLTATDARGNTIRYEYNAGGHPSKVADALGNVTTYGYDANGNRTSMTDARGQTTSYEFDLSSRVTKTTFPDGTTSLTTYDAAGQPTVKTDQAGKATRFEYDKRGKLLKVTDALGGVTRFTYDEVGKLLTQTDANNHTTSFEHDRLGRRTGRTLPLGMSETFVYDSLGNLTARTDFRGKTTTYQYDSMNRLVSKTPDASLGEPPVSYTYTATDRRATMTDASGTNTYTYDALDHLLTKQTPQGTLTYTYDAMDNVLSVRSSNAEGVSTNYAYDALNRLSSATDTRSGVTTYAYDPNGNLAGALYPNGVQTAYTYNTLNRLTNLTAAAGGSAPLAGYAYTLGAAGNRLSVTEQNGRAVTYTHDALYRLTGEAVANDPATNGSVAYAYDAVGNRLSRTSTVPGLASTASAYDANDRLTSDSYDQNGNTTAAGGNSYAYNSENRLTSAGGGSASYVYDGDGNRVAKTAGGVTTRFLVDTNNPTGYAQVVEELVGGSVRRQYTYGHDLISQRQLIGGQWQTSFYGYDGHGSVRYLTDSAASVTDTYTYDVFGNLIARTGSTPNDYLYAGEQFDPNIGFYYLRARYMNPSTGRFQTMDEFEGVRHDPLTLHKYLYANANPADNIDPSGHFSIAGMAMTMAIGGIINAMVGMIFSQHSPTSSEFWGEAAWNFGVGAVTAPVGGLAARLLAPLVRATVAPLLQILGRMKPIMLTGGKTAVEKMLVKISRFFVNTNKTYPSVQSTGLGRLLQRVFPSVRWEHHHIFIQQSWSRVGKPNQIYADLATNEGLRRVGNGLWNMIPIPRAFNAAMGRSELGTQLFATAYYSIIVYGTAHTLVNFFDGDE
jgi:RHS repeat-associated protein